MTRENQTSIALRLDPDLLAAVDIARSKLNMSRSQFLRLAIFEAVKQDSNISVEAAFPKDRTGESRRPRKKREKTSSRDRERDREAG